MFCTEYNIMSPYPCLKRNSNNIFFFRVFSFFKIYHAFLVNIFLWTLLDYWRLFSYWNKDILDMPYTELARKSVERCKKYNYIDTLTYFYFNHHHPLLSFYQVLHQCHVIYCQYQPKKFRFQLRITFT